MTRATRLMALTLILPLATACADMGEDEMGEEAADTATAPSTAPAESETFALQGVNESGITGEIESEAMGDSVFLDVTMEGATGSDYAAHVHSGSCDQMQAPVAAQVSLQWGMAGEGAGMESGTSDEQPSGGMGEAATGDDQGTHVRVGVATSDLTGSQGDHSLRFHGSGGEVIACADLPADLTGSMGMESGDSGMEDTEGR